MRIQLRSGCRLRLFPNSRSQAVANHIYGLRLTADHFLPLAGKDADTGIVNVRYGRLYRFGQHETQIPSIWLKYLLAFQ